MPRASTGFEPLSVVRLVPSLEMNEEAPPRSGRAPAGTSAGAPHTSLQERTELAENLDDPLNRYYRYPAARGLLRIAGGLPLRPDHITYIHTMFGMTGAALIAVSTSHASMALAFVLLEIRMILDCYDGVLARAKKLSSPRGRTLDELGDATAYIAICIGMGVHVYRTHPGLMSVAQTVAFGAVVIAMGGMSGHAYDFYKRRLGPALKEGRDSIAEELEQKRELVRSGRATGITRFGIWFDRWQVRLYEPRYAGADPVGVVLARSHEPGVRFLVKLVGFISWDNVLGLISVAVLLDRILEVQLLALAYGFVMFTTARFTIWRVLGGRARS